jgi:hypothetical protein
MARAHKGERNRDEHQVEDDVGIEFAESGVFHGQQDAGQQRDGDNDSVPVDLFGEVSDPDRKGDRIQREVCGVEHDPPSSNDDMRAEKTDHRRNSMPRAIPDSVIRNRRPNCEIL